ncbi:MAG TPA: hypothetical protein PK263_00345 [bacterium]|nr:hypothetical protein [bacterium]
MEEIKSLSQNTNTFLGKFSDALFKPKAGAESKNEKVLSSALIYEKFRVAIEYQEEHLIFKNAISRIVRRKYTLSSTISSDALYADVVNELAWANYLNPESLTEIQVKSIKEVFSRYLVLLRYARSARFKKHEVQGVLIGWMACEIDAIVKPSNENEILLDYAYSVLKSTISIEGSRVSEPDHELQLKIVIMMFLLRPDLPQVQLWLVDRIYPKWREFDKEEAKKFARSFDPYFNKVERVLNFPLRSRYLSYVRRNIAPFILIRALLASGKIEESKVKGNPTLFKNLLLEVYDSMVVDAREKVWRGTWRALIFIVLTKISLAFLLEVPFDKYLSGEINYVSLIINVALPPALMLLAGTFVKSPPLNNRIVVANALYNIITKDKVDSKNFILAKREVLPWGNIFNLLYAVFSISIMIGVITLLRRLDFNILSIFLFFFFVSVVSFFSFRIRNIALELAMKRSKDDALTSAMEFLLLPFIRVGKSISERFARLNPFIVALDFLIEAPLKTIMKFTNSWFRFINSKKEELEN